MFTTSMEPKKIDLDSSGDRSNGGQWLFYGGAIPLLSRMMRKAGNSSKLDVAEVKLPGQAPGVILQRILVMIRTIAPVLPMKKQLC